MFLLFEDCRNSSRFREVPACTVPYIHPPVYLISITFEVNREWLYVLKRQWEYSVVLCCAVLYCTVLCCTVLCCAVLYWLYCTVLYCTVLYCTVLYCNVLYCLYLYYLLCIVLSVWLTFGFKVCKSVHHRTVQINHQPDATIFQFIILTFIYNSACFGCSSAHHQELNDCSSSLWFYLRIVVIVMEFVCVFVCIYTCMYLIYVCIYVFLICMYLYMYACI